MFWKNSMWDMTVCSQLGLNFLNCSPKQCWHPPRQGAESIVPCIISRITASLITMLASDIVTTEMRRSCSYSGSKILRFILGQTIMVMAHWVPDWGTSEKDSYTQARRHFTDGPCLHCHIDFLFPTFRTLF